MATSELDRFCKFCRRLLTTERGEPFVIEGFQRRILTDFFDGCRETIVIIGKKSGKTSLVAAVAIWHLLVTPQAEVVIVAASRDQASIMLRQVQGFIRRCRPLRNRLRVVQREVRDERTGGRIRVLAADSDTLDGQIPTLALVDELARTRTEEAYGLLRDGLGPRDGRLIAISTAGDDEESPLGRLRAAAHGMPSFERDGAYKHARRDGFSYHEWSLEPDQDPTDLELLKTANPASWVDMDELRARRDSPSTQPWQLARFSAGQWVVGEESAISRQEWSACADPNATIPDGAAAVHIGVDLGWKWDTTAFVPTWRRAEVGEPESVYEQYFVPPDEQCSWGGCTRVGRVREYTCDWEGTKQSRFCDLHAPAASQDVERGAPAPMEEDDAMMIVLGEPVILTPPKDGTSLDHEEIFGIAAMYATRYKNPVFVVDPQAGGEQLAQRIEKELPATVVTYSQQPTSMCAASQRFAELVAAGKLRHPDNQELNSHVLSAAAKFTGPMWRFVRPRGKRLPIDGVIAASMACQVLATQQPATGLIGWL